MLTDQQVQADASRELTTVYSTTPHTRGAITGAVYQPLGVARTSSDGLLVRNQMEKLDVFSLSEREEWFAENSSTTQSRERQQVRLDYGNRFNIAPRGDHNNDEFHTKLYHKTLRFERLYNAVRTSWLCVYSR